MNNKIIVESKNIFKLGIQEKAFECDNIIAVDDTWHRICKPTDSKPKCIILWACDAIFMLTILQFRAAVLQCTMPRTLPTLPVNIHKSF
jgi:hypothetical protein